MGIMQVGKDVQFGELHKRLRKADLHDLIEFKGQGRSRPDSVLSRQTRQELGLSLRTYQRYKLDGKYWSAIRGRPEGPLDGLLCLIPFSQEEPLRVQAKDYIELDPKELLSLHSLLSDDYMASICVPARRQKQCDYCDADKCVCLGTIVEVVPRIKRYGAVRGLQAVALNAGAVAYEKGSFIGVIAGDLYPLGTYEDEHWTFDFKRPDLEDHPAVCQLRMAEVSNCFRLLGTAEDPSALLVIKRRGGRWVMAVEAKRSIMDNDQITVRHSGGCGPCTAASSAVRSWV
ncbi:hypothetical protein EV126DRAFT_439785 [Verticillium dahliae]|nr:hypothetical protein EV126DRAFT_439785 [Verticillium dahliae]